MREWKWKKRVIFGDSTYLKIIIPSWCRELLAVCLKIRLKWLISITNPLPSQSHSAGPTMRQTCSIVRMNSSFDLLFFYENSIFWMIKGIILLFLLLIINISLVKYFNSICFKPWHAWGEDVNGCAGLELDHQTPSWTINLR